MMTFDTLHRILSGRLPCAVRQIVAALCLTLIIGALAAGPASAQTSSTRTEQKKANNETKSRTQAMRTLDEVNIEGEIAVPQVLFITSRDYPRYRDGLRWKYRKSATDVGRSIDLPTRLRVAVKTVMYKEEDK